MERALTEIAKFLTFQEVLMQFQLTCTQWKKVALNEEVLLHFLPDEGDNSQFLPLYQRVKEEYSHPRYLLNVAHEQMSVWDLQTDSTWTFASPLFLNSSKYVLCSMSTAFVTGGVGNYRSCVKVNLETGAIESLPESLHDRAWHGIAILHNEVYVTGGYIDKEYIFTAEKYSQDRWVELPSMQKPRCNHKLCVLQAKVYAFGGSNGRYYLDSIEEFDGKRWTLLEVRLPIHLSYPNIVAKNNVCILIGKYDRETTERKVYSLGLKSNAWTQLFSIQADYSISNAATLKAGKLLFFTLSGERVSVVLQQISLP